ncbi:hypothetical protein Dsin_012038 [Dipteronia sinensis]|uniref:1-phosphatidylinositol 4-kinase n=1 Tax=Dipteronia sinensis TaxID=43782 RepID=A0AAE0AH91_9ROSI|nr:hypothetical protein Dsin_012038 [Dipteronia sinensis]
MAVVIDPHHGFKPFNRAQRCRLQSFTHLDFNVLELSQSNFAHSLKQTFEVDNIHRSYSTPCFSVASDVEDELETGKRIEIVGGRGAPGLRALVVEVAIALASGVEPISVSSGLGGAYFLPARNGQMMTREFRGEENQSVLETLCAKAKTSVMNISVDDDGEKDEERNDQNKDEEEEFEMFQFDNESEDHANEFMDHPRLLQNPPAVSKPPKIPKFSTAKSMPKLHDVLLSPLFEEKMPENDETNANTVKRNGGGSGNDENKVVGCFTKSLSFSAQSCNYHDQTGGITLGDMSECDWESFLESFEKLLPQVFEGIISMGVKQRLGSSCEF